MGLLSKPAQTVNVDSRSRSRVKWYKLYERRVLGYSIIQMLFLGKPPNDEDCTVIPVYMRKCFASFRLFYTQKQVPILQFASHFRLHELLQLSNLSFFSTVVVYRSLSNAHAVLHSWAVCAEVAASQRLTLLFRRFLAKSALLGVNHFASSKSEFFYHIHNQNGT